MAAKDTDDQKTDDQDNEHTLDMSQAAVKKMIADARERGYITYDQLNQVLPPEQVSSEQIEDVMSMLSEMGINVIEDDEGGDDPANAGAVVEAPTPREVALSSSSTATLDRTRIARSLAECGRTPTTSSSKGPTRAPTTSSAT